MDHEDNMYSSSENDHIIFNYFSYKFRNVGNKILLPIFLALAGNPRSCTIFQYLLFNNYLINTNIYIFENCFNEC